MLLSEHLEGSIGNWSVDNLSAQEISNLEADCYWCLSKFLDGMQDHLRICATRDSAPCFQIEGTSPSYHIDEPLSKQIEEQGLEFLQFSIGSWFNCLLIREVPFHFVTHLWDTYLAGDYLPDFLLYITTSFLLTISGQTSFRNWIPRNGDIPSVPSDDLGAP